MTSWSVGIWLAGLRVRVHLVQLGPGRFVAQSHGGEFWGDGTQAELAVARLAARAQHQLLLRQRTFA